jgi:hypothetical protein
MMFHCHGHNALRLPYLYIGTPFILLFFAP